MKTMSIEKAEAVLNDILAIDVEGINPVQTERKYLSGFAVDLRVFFKSLGFSNRKISVVVPDYAMAMMLDITIPDVNFYDMMGIKGYEDLKTLPAAEYDAGYAKHKNFRQLRHEARQHLSNVILAAFPANGDRGDVYTDYFDHTFMIH